MEYNIGQHIETPEGVYVRVFASHDGSYLCPKCSASVDKDSIVRHNHEHWTEQGFLGLPESRDSDTAIYKCKNSGHEASDDDVIQKTILIPLSEYEEIEERIRKHSEGMLKLIKLAYSGKEDKLFRGM